MDSSPLHVSGPITIFLNGRARQIAAPTPLLELARQHRLDPKALLVELNGQTLRRDEWPEQHLAHGDRVEFIRVVAGG